jgi:hypothetical protein
MEKISTSINTDNESGKTKKLTNILLFIGVHPIDYPRSSGKEAMTHVVKAVLLYPIIYLLGTHPNNSTAVKMPHFLAATALVG